MKNKNYKKDYEELENLFKALLNKSYTKQVIITNDEVENVKHCKIYVTKELMRYGYRYELIDERNLYKVEEN